MVEAIEFRFSPFDSPLEKLQNCILSKFRNYSVVETYLDILLWGPGFRALLTNVEPSLGQKVTVWVKTDVIFEISIKNWVDPYMFHIFLKISIFVENLTWTPPQGCLKNWFLSKWCFDRSVFCRFASNDVFEDLALRSTGPMAFLREINFWDTPEGESRSNFRRK